MERFGFLLNGVQYSVERVPGCTAFKVTRQGGESVTMSAENISLSDMGLAGNLFLLLVAMRHTKAEEFKALGMVPEEVKEHILRMINDLTS